MKKKKVQDPDFAGQFDFAFGDVRGLRLWLPMPASLAEVDTSPVLLRSVYRPFMWSEGVNCATCTTQPGVSVRTFECRYGHTHGPTWPYGADNDECHSPHLAGGMDPQHTCGFYAYSATEDNPYLEDIDDKPVVEGVIQGFGRVVIGDYGFRCSRARILGLLPHRGTEYAQRWHDRIDEDLRKQYPHIPVFESRDALLDAYPLTHPGEPPHD